MLDKTILLGWFGLWDLIKGIVTSLLTAVAVARWAALALMIRAGTLLKSRQWRIIKGLCGIMITGALFKILHIAGADLMLYTPIPLVAGAYLWRFFEKENKSRLDVLKCLWVISFIVTPIIEGIILPKWGYYLNYRGLNLITISLFWITFIDFYLNHHQAK